jgi:hypothetical protein
MVSLSSSARCKRDACLDLGLTGVQSVVCEMHASREQQFLNRDFEKLFLEAVDEGLAYLGESTSRTIYYHLESDFNIKKQGIPRNIEAFADALEKIFGDGAGLLEIEIMKKLHEKVGNSFVCFSKQKDLVFTEYIETVKLSYMTKLI